MINSTTQAISGWYAIDPRFAHDILVHFIGDQYNTDLLTVADIYDFYKTHKEQLEYAFSTNKRGFDLVSNLQRIGIAQLNSKGAKYLDIGCAYAGFLTAFSRAGYEVAGVEFSPKLTELGSGNLSYTDVQCKIKCGDFLDNDVIENKEAYDLITCNDVIEHISNPYLAIKKIYSILNPGGYAFLETVNKRSIVNVRSEIHSGIFGISLLDHHSSNAIYKEVRETSSDFEISDFYHLEWYLNIARSCGGIANSVGGSEEISSHQEELMRLWVRYLEWKNFEQPKLSYYSSFTLEEALFEYMSDFHVALAKAHQHHDYKHFQASWIDPVIRFTIHKPIS